MQGQIGGVNGFVVIIFVHYILSDKVVLELENQRGGGRGVAEGCDLVKR